MTWTACATALVLALAVDGPRTPDEERASFRLADPSLVVELVAAEPDVVSPVAIAWDEAGAMYVAEMTDYPVGPPSGRIRRLADPDPVTGRFRSVTFFARDVPFPTGVLPHDGGLLVTSAPDVLFLKDGDGDGVADTREAVLTGFGEGNQQLRVNALHYGLDNRIYGANGRSGGALRRPGDPADRAVAIDRADFRVDPGSFEVEAVGGFSQFGLAADDWGDRFPSWNTVPIRHVVLERDLLERNGHPATPTGVADVIAPGDVAVYPVSQAPRTFNKESVRAFNASCGTTIYRGDMLGEAAGDVFVAEPLTQLVHRRRLVPEGASYRAVRREEGREFLAAEDPWFHPVNFATGPDGCLYVVDFYREWVEHPDFVPADSRGEVDWRRGAEHGRIWRVRRKDAPRAEPVKLEGATVEALVQAIGHANGWVRDTAQRLLVARGDKGAAGPLRELAEKGGSPQGRSQALWTLEGLGELDQETLRRALSDPHPKVREQALRLVAADPAREDAVAGELPALANDANARVRFRCALLLAGRPDAGAVEALAAILGRDVADPWVGVAVLSGWRGPVAPLLDEIAGWLETEDGAKMEFLRRLGGLAGARGDGTDWDGVIARARPGAGEGLKPGGLALLTGWVEGRAGPGALPEALGPALDAAEAALGDPRTAAGVRVLALRLLLEARPGALPGLLPALLGAGEDPALQKAAAGAVGRLGDEATAREAVGAWARLTTSTRRELLGGMVRSPALAGVLADAIEEEMVAPAEVDADLRVAVGHLPDAGARNRLAGLLGPTTADRGPVVQEARQAIARLGREADAGRGAELFTRLCATCHRLGGRGAEVGPDLSGIAARPAEALVDDILDPSREVSPDFRAFVAADRVGRVFSGLLVSEAPAGVTLRGPGGENVFLAREGLETLRSTDKSLMPDGFEAQLDARALADLIAYLKAPAGAP